MVGEVGEGWKIIEEVEIGVLEPSTERACHPSIPSIVVHFWDDVGKDHSQPGPEEDYGHPRDIFCKDDVNEHAERESNIRVEGGGELPDKMVEDDSLPKTDEDAMNAKTVVFGCCVNKKA